jgi:hypothetical protein
LKAIGLEKRVIEQRVVQAKEEIVG